MTSLKNLLLRGLCVVAMSVPGMGHAQTTALDPTGDGGFENGITFADNGWTEVNDSAGRRWRVGAIATPFAGNKSAYLGNANNYNGSQIANTRHFYRDLVIPATATNVSLSFYYKQPNIDNTNDFAYVSTTTTATTPTEGIAPTTAGGYDVLLTNTATAYPTYTLLTYPLTGAAGTTVRLVFSETNNAVTPFGNPLV